MSSFPTLFVSTCSGFKGREDTGRWGTELQTLRMMFDSQDTYTLNDSTFFGNNIVTLQV